MKKTKKLFMQSTIVLVLCISMLIGTTFAWFSDSVTSRDNVITSGNLDLEMYWTDNLDSGEWFNVEDDEHNTIFN
jgi:predicted ribosomally synthesized peptide with SipW-like signal peptide